MSSRNAWGGLLLVLACGGLPRPIADPGPLERSGEADVAIEFDGSTSKGSVDSWSWDFGDGASESGVRVSHAYAQPGDYSVTLTVRGPGGLDTASVLVSIGAGCNAKAGIAVLTTDPQPAAPVQFFSSGSSGCNGAALVHYAWDFGDGATEAGPGRTTVSHTYAAKGSYVIVLEVTDADGHKGRASRTLGVGVSAAKPVAQCAPAASAITGRAATLSATASDPGGSSIASYRWQFSDDGSTATASTGTIQHTFTSAGQFTASVTATTQDARVSEPCVTTVTVSAPPSYAGLWLLNPGASSLSGCSQFTVGFPAATLELTHSGNSMTATPAGNSWPAGHALSGTEDPPPATPGTFRLSGILPNENKGSCGAVEPEHRLQLDFTAPTTVSGAWRVIYTASCVGSGCSALCNCAAQGTFSGIRQ